MLSYRTGNMNKKQAFDRGFVKAAIDSGVHPSHAVQLVKRATFDRGFIKAAGRFDIVLDALKGASKGVGNQLSKVNITKAIKATKFNLPAPAVPEGRYSSIFKQLSGQLGAADNATTSAHNPLMQEKLNQMLQLISARGARSSLHPLQRGISGTLVNHLAENINLDKLKEIDMLSNRQPWTEEAAKSMWTRKPATGMVRPNSAHANPSHSPYGFTY